MLHDVLGAGGMATVHIGRLIGPSGFSRTVAIKRLHPHVAMEQEFASALLDEGKIVSRIRHPNVVSVVDIVAEGNDLLLVLEYVPGESLARLSKIAKGSIPLPVVSAIACDMLHGLQAAHEATSENGEPLGIVHRDISPQNIIVGSDGISRVLDFGIAKAAGRIHTTRDGRIKGKMAYMAPEQLRGARVSRRTDVYAAGVVLWEMLTGKMLFSSEQEGALVEQVLLGTNERPSKYAPEIPDALDDLVMKSLDPDPEKRFSTAKEMSEALRDAVRPALAVEVSAWIEKLAGESLERRAERVATIESLPTDGGAEKRSRAPLFLALALVGAASFGFFAWSRDHDTIAHADAPRPEPTIVAPPATTSTPIPATSTVPAPSIVPAPPPATTKPTIAPKPSAAPTASVDCSNPKRVDPVTGAISYRPECLH